MTLLRRDLLVAGWTSAFLAFLGVPLGLLAAALTPHLASGLYPGGPDGGAPFFLSAAREEDPAVFGGDGVMLAVLAGAGLLVGVAAVVWGRRCRGGTICGVVLGGALAGLVAMAVHHQVLHPAYARIPLTPGSVGASVQLRPYVRGTADFAVLPFVAVLVVLLSNVRWLLGGGASVAESPAGPDRPRTGPGPAVDEAA